MKLNKIFAAIFASFLLFEVSSHAQTTDNSNNTKSHSNSSTTTSAVGNQDSQDSQDSNVSDTKITQNVKKKISSDKSLEKYNIQVNTEEGVVQLIGNLDTEDQADTVIELTESVKGVKDTDSSKLTIKESQSPVSDAVITAKVKGVFFREELFGDKETSPMTIKVETTDGVVNLSGTADSQTEANNAVSLAKVVKGVKEVKSNIVVKQ